MPKTPVSINDRHMMIALTHDMSSGWQSNNLASHDMTNRFRFVGMGSICASDESQPFSLKAFGESRSQSNPDQPMLT